MATNEEPRLGPGQSTQVNKIQTPLSRALDQACAIQDRVTDVYTQLATICDGIGGERPAGLMEEVHEEEGKLGRLLLAQDKSSQQINLINLEIERLQGLL